MSGAAESRTSPESAWGWDAVEQELRRAAAGQPCSVHLMGNPGGLIQLGDGCVLDTWTAGSPLAVPAPDRRQGAPVIAPGDSRKQATAIADAIFVMAAGHVTGLRNDPGGGAVEGGIPLDPVLREVRRRLVILAGDGGRPPLNPESQPFRCPDAPSSTDARPLLLTAPERAVLDLADGINTVRDIAFVVNRGIYAVLLDITRLVDIGQVTLTEGRSVTTPGEDDMPPTPFQPPPFRAGSGVLGLFARRRPRPAPLVVPSDAVSLFSSGHSEG